MFKFSRFSKFAIVAVLLSVGVFASIAYASHSWGRYHWARTSNPFTLKLGDNVSEVWDTHLITASSDWTASSVLNTTIVGGASTDCLPISGRVEVCNKTYGNNGWLGIAQIWVTKGTHITKGLVKMNDTYFDSVSYNYNTPAWRRFVMCQEVGHTFGLGHQDENFNNVNLGSCMDYTNDPDGTLATPDQLTNELPNEHDYAQLETIYAHLDKTTTIGQVASGPGNHAGVSGADGQEVADWGKSIRSSSDGRSSLFERDFGGGNKVFTFVIWAD